MVRCRKFGWRGLFFWLALGMSLSTSITASAVTEKLAVDLIRVDKSDRRLDLVAEGQVIRSCWISLGSHPFGAKIQQGDKKTPEDRYVIDWRNPDSRYFRALHISYPNAADRADVLRHGVDPGGMIMIHGLPASAAGDGDGYVGMDWTDGCIALTHEEIDQLWEVVKDGTPIEIVS